MYKFTNGLVFYSEEEAKKAISVGYKLVEKQLKVDDVIDETDKSGDKPISESDKTNKNNVKENNGSVRKG